MFTLINALLPLSTGVPYGLVIITKSTFVSYYGGLELTREIVGERPGTLDCCGQSLADRALHLPHPGTGSCC